MFDEEESYTFKDEIAAAIKSDYVRSRLLRPGSKFSNLISDIDIPGDPYFLSKYRSFHNHELDSNMIEYNSLVLEKDLHRKGAVTLLPQGPMVFFVLSLCFWLVLFVVGGLCLLSCSFV